MIVQPEGLVSCDTFVVMGDSTATGDVIFGKNSDRYASGVCVIYAELSSL